MWHISGAIKAEKPQYELSYCDNLRQTVDFKIVTVTYGKW